MLVRARVTRIGSVRATHSRHEPRAWREDALTQKLADRERTSVVNDEARGGHRMCMMLELWGFEV